MSMALRILGGLMDSEMRQQPSVLSDLATRWHTLDIPRADLKRAARAGMMLVARGSSDNAAIFGRYVFESDLGVLPALAAPSIWTRYARPASVGGRLIIALSQSGKTPEVEQLLRMARNEDGTCVAITNDAKSPLAAAADLVIPLEAGLEQAVPATKTFSAQVTALALLAATLAGTAGPRVEQTLEMCDRLREILSDPEPAREMAHVIAAARAVVFVGSGFLFPIACESALKLVETTSIPALAYSANDFLHGPTAVASPDIPVIVLSGPGPTHVDAMKAADAASERGAPVLWVPTTEESAQTADRNIGLTDPEPLTVLTYAVRAQQLALETSRTLGLDPDQPNGLKKVTLT